MPNENYELSNTRFGEAMQRKMDELGLSIRDVAVKLGSTYEYSRRLVRGISLPSKYMAVALSEILNWDRSEIMRLSTADKIELKHGSIPLEISGKNPELEHFERGWHMLTEQEKELLRNQYDTFIRQHKKSQRHKA